MHHIAIIEAECRFAKGVIFWKGNPERFLHYCLVAVRVFLRPQIIYCYNMTLFSFFSAVLVSFQKFKLFFYPHLIDIPNGIFLHLWAYLRRWLSLRSSYLLILPPNEQLVLIFTRDFSHRV